jgi:hypothetical protein
MATSAPSRTKAIAWCHQSLLQLIRRDAGKDCGNRSYRQEKRWDVLGPPQLLGVRLVFPAIGYYPSLALEAMEVEWHQRQLR